MAPTTRPARVRRTVLAVPGSSDRFIAKARTLRVDPLFLDLEDAVAPAVKAEPRRRIVDALNDPEGFAAPTLTVRVNDWTTPWTFRDVADVVIGARFAGIGSYTVRGPRRWAMKLLSTVLSRIARTTLTDTTSGFKACGRRAIALYARNYPAEYLGDTVESLVIALRTGCRVEQLPVSMRTRSAGTASQNTARSVLYLARAMVALGLALVRRWPATLEAVPQELA